MDSKKQQPAHQVWQRRSLLTAGVGLALGSIVSCRSDNGGQTDAQQAAEPATPDVAAKNPSLGPTELYARARGGAGNDPGLWWYSGRLWGQPAADKAVQFFAVEGFSFNNMIRREDGSLAQIMEEVGFWKDPESGAVLDDWVNPLNGLPCEPGHFRSRQELEFSADGVLTRPEVLDGHITEPTLSGPTMWISEILLGRFDNPRKQGQDPLTYVGPVRTVTSLATYAMDAEQILSSVPGFVETTLHFQSMSKWYPWMRMGQAQGNISFELSGRKLPRVDDLPDSLRSIIEQRRAGFLDNPDIQEKNPQFGNQPNNQ